jgi:hypothetical protein
VRALEDLIEIMTGWDDVWLTTAADIALHTRSLGLVPRVFPQPEI